nr:hypothetical protein [Tanacetum cinerariifolium]
ILLSILSCRMNAVSCGLLFYFVSNVSGYPKLQVVQVLLLVVLVRTMGLVPTGSGTISAGSYSFILLDWFLLVVVSRVGFSTTPQMVFSSPWLTAKKELTYHEVQEQTALGKDKSNPLNVGSLLKTTWSSIHHLLTDEVLTSPEQTATGKDVSNPLMAMMVCQKPLGYFSSPMIHVPRAERVFNPPGCNPRAYTCRSIKNLEVNDVTFKIRGGLLGITKVSLSVVPVVS